MPRFSQYFSLGLSQHQLDFVDINNEEDIPVYVDPYAIEIRDDLWSAEASRYLRSFFGAVLGALHKGRSQHAVNLMSHLNEPKETFLGVSKGTPRGRGLGSGQSGQLIEAIKKSKAFKSGLLADLSEMALYVEGIDRDKISDLTTNVIRSLLVLYTRQQCELFSIPASSYSGPPLWDPARENWVSRYVELPFIEESPVLLVPKFIVRRSLSLDGQEFYNKQITDFLVAEQYNANTSLVHVLQKKDGPEPKVYKGEVRKTFPKSKEMIADMVVANPELLTMYKDIAKKHGIMYQFDESGPSLPIICESLAKLLPTIELGVKKAGEYHTLILGAFTALFFPDLILPHKEWEINNGRKRIDIVFTNRADTGFFAQRRNDPKVNANTVIVECKNYSSDLANQELDQLLGRFDDNRGKFGIITCRSATNEPLLLQRCKDASSRSQGYMIVLTDEDVVKMLSAKARLRDNDIQNILHRKYRDLLA